MIRRRDVFADLSTKLLSTVFCCVSVFLFFFNIDLLYSRISLGARELAGIFDLQVSMEEKLKKGVSSGELRSAAGMTKPLGFGEKRSLVDDYQRSIMFNCDLFFLDDRGHVFVATSGANDKFAVAEIFSPGTAEKNTDLRATFYFSDNIYLDEKLGERTVVCDHGVDLLGSFLNSYPIVCSKGKLYIYFSNIVVASADLKDLNGNKGKALSVCSLGNRIFTVVSPSDGTVSANNLLLSVFEVGEFGKRIDHLCSEKIEPSIFELVRDSVEFAPDAKFNLCASEELGRVFLSVSGVVEKQDSGLSEYGATSVVSVQLSGDEGGSGIMFEKLIAEGAVPVKSDAENKGQERNILIFLSDSGSGFKASTSHLATLHSSTGRDYIVTLSETVADRNKKFFVYALPLVSRGRPLLSSKSFPSIAAKKTEDFFDMENQEDRAAAIVGDGPLPVVYEGFIVGIRVVGDAVYVGLCGDRMSQGRENGIYASFAIFDNMRNIVGWTRWQKVAFLESFEKLLGFSRDRRDGNFTFFYENSSGFHSFATTTMSTGFPDSRFIMSYGHVINEFFSSGDQSSLFFSLFDFDDSYFGGSFAATVAVGEDKVLICQSAVKMNQILRSASSFVKFELNGENKLGFLYLADIARRKMGDSDALYLFVGGFDGISVLSKEDGSPAVIKDSDDISDTFVDCNFYSISGLGRITKIFVHDDTIFFATRRAIYGIKIKEENLGKNFSFDLAERVFSLGEIFSQEDSISDFLVVTLPNGKLFFIVGVSSELLSFVYEGKEVVEHTDMVISRIDYDPIFPVLQMEFFERGDHSSDKLCAGDVLGNLYALISSCSLDYSHLYRFALKYDRDAGTAVLLSVEHGFMYSFGEYRGRFFYDGSFIYSMMSKHFDRKDLLRIVPVSGLLDRMRVGDRTLDIGLRDDEVNSVQDIVRSGFTGSFLITTGQRVIENG